MSNQWDKAVLQRSSRIKRLKVAEEEISRSKQTCSGINERRYER